MDEDSQLLDKIIWCRLAPSSIHGIGVFAIRDIPKGTSVLKQHYFSFEKRDIEEMDLETRNLILDYFLVRKSHGVGFYYPFTQFECYFNHSSDSNVDRECKTTRLVRKGEELTQDYNYLLEGASEISINHLNFI